MKRSGAFVENSQTRFTDHKSLLRSKIQVKRHYGLRIFDIKKYECTLQMLHDIYIMIKVTLL